MKKIFLTGLAVIAFAAFAGAQTETPVTETPPPPATETPTPPADGSTDGTTTATDGATTDPAVQPAAVDSLGNPIPPAEGAPAAAAAPAAPEKPRYKLYSGKHRGNNSVGPKQ